MKAYLSIDLDYWHRSTFDACTKFFQQVWALKLPIYVAMYHHHLLPHINASDCDTLINIDHHSDLEDLNANHVLDFGEGTWGNFVDWRYHGTFVWRYPRTGGIACHGIHDPFQENVSQWQVTKKRPGLCALPWTSVKAVGVCLSPDYIGAWDVLTEPLTKLHVTQWLRDQHRFDNYKMASCKHRPKFVRVR